MSVSVSSGSLTSTYNTFRKQISFVFHLRCFLCPSLLLLGTEMQNTYWDHLTPLPSLCHIQDLNSPGSISAISSTCHVPSCLIYITCLQHLSSGLKESYFTNHTQTSLNSQAAITLSSHLQNIALYIAIIADYLYAFLWTFHLPFQTVSLWEESVIIHVQ